MVVTLLTTVLLCLIVLPYLYRTVSNLIRERGYGRKIMHLLDSPRPHWLFGSLQEIQPTEGTILKIAKETQTYPKVGQLWFGPFISYLMVFHSHTVKPILSTAEPKDNMAYRFIRPWIGDGLLVSSGKKWHRNRHLLTRAFHFDILKEYVKVFNKCTTTLLTKWDSFEKNAPIEMFEHVSLFTLDNMLQCTISCDTNCQVIGSEHKYISSVLTLTSIAMKRLFNPFCHNDFIFSLTPSGRKFKAACDYIHQYDEQVINERKSSIKNLLNNCNEDLELSDIQQVTEIRRKSGKYLDFLDILLLTRDEDGKGLSDREVRDEVDTFLFEGHDTTASGISWALYCLAAYPEYQEKCREEIQNILGDKENVDWEDLQKFTYLNMFIKEVLRLYPPVFAVGRRIENSVTFPRGFGEDQKCLKDKPDNPAACSLRLQAPYNIGVPLIVLHRNESVWENPDVFDPSRFEASACASRSPYAYLPFSAGPRNCIGQNFALAEMKVALARILMRHRVYADDECQKPMLSPMVVLKSTNGIHLKLETLH